MLVIGSVALANHIKNFRQNSDLDLVCSRDQALDFIKLHKMRILKVTESQLLAEDSSSEKVEIHFNDVEPYKTVYELGIENSSKTVNAVYKIPSIDFLYSLKMAHRFKDHVHFNKTMSDIHLMREAGAKLISDDRFEYLASAFTKKPISLKQSADKFFRESDGFYVLNHDDIHDSIVSHKQAAYKMIIDGEVWCDMKKFDSLPLIDKLSCAVEECFVLAIERAVLPNFGKDYSLLSQISESKIKKAYKVSLQKVCTRVTSGKFREFCWENHDLILKLFDFQMYRNFLEALKNNKIRDFKA